MSKLRAAVVLAVACIILTTLGELRVYSQSPCGLKPFPKELPPNVTIIWNACQLQGTVPGGLETCLEGGTCTQAQCPDIVGCPCFIGPGCAQQAMRPMPATTAPGWLTSSGIPL